MAIKNPDGSTYKVSGSIEQFDADDPSHKLFNFWDQQALLQGGSPLYYYEVIITDQMIDKVNMEARGKLFSPIPVKLQCNYDPTASQNLMGMFGVDAPDEVIFEVNIQDVIQKIGHAPKNGSRFFSPHLSENWLLIQTNLAEFKMWGALRWQLICQKFQETSTTGEGRVTSKKPTSYKIN